MIMKISKLAVALALCGGAFAASAQTAVTNMAVSATIAGSCTLLANPLAFSVYDPASPTPLDGFSTVVLTCTTGAGSVLAMGQGLYSTGAGLTTQRRLRSGGVNNLNYALFQPATAVPGAACAYTDTWGNGTLVGQPLAIGAAPSGTARTFNVCGRIPAGQALPAGTYADTVVVTVTL